MPNYDGSTRILSKIDLDDRDAQKRLQALEKNINKLQADLNKSSARRSAIAEQLEQARAKAAEARKEIERIKSTRVETPEYAALGKEMEDLAKKTAALDAKRRRYLATGGSEDSAEFRRMEYDAAQLVDAYERARVAKEALESSGGAYTTLGETGTVTAELREQEAILARQEASTAKLEAEDRERAIEASNTTAQLEAQRMEVDQINAELTTQSAKAWPKVQDAAEKASNAFNKSVKSLVRYGLGLRSLFALFRRLRSSLIDGIKQFANIDAQTQASINNLKASLNGLKGSFAAAFAPVVNAVVPILVTLIEWVTKAANAVSMFFAVLTGKSSYKRAVAGLNSVAGAASGAGAAAAEAAKQFSGLDELNVWDSGSSGGGGGGGGGSSGGDLTWEDVALNTVPEFISDLAISFQDVILDWTGLTGEQIAEKVIAGACGLVAGLAGFTLTGSLAGGVMGAIVGVGLGIVIDTIIFDHDGEIGNAEVWNMIALAAVGLTGGVLGLMAGGTTGTLLGATVGAVLYIALSAQFSEMGAMSRSQALTTICGALGALVGGALAFAVSGGKIVPTLVGGILGLVLGIGISAEFTEEDLNGNFGDVIKKIKDKFLEKVKENGGGFTGVATTILQYMGEGFKQIVTWVDSTIITPLMNRLGLGSVWTGVKEVGSTILTNIGEGLKTLPSWVGTNVITPLSNALKTGNWDDIKEAGKTILDNLKEGIGDLAVWAITDIINPLGQAIGGENWNDIDPESGKRLVAKLFEFDIWAWLKEHVIGPLVSELEAYNWSGLWDSILSGLKDAIVNAVLDAVESIPVLGDAFAGEMEGIRHTQEIVSDEGTTFWNMPFRLLADDNTNIFNMPFQLAAAVISLDDQIPPEDKVIEDTTADVSDVTTQGMGSRTPMIESTANVVDMSDKNLSATQKTIDTTANLTKRTFASDTIQKALTTASMVASLVKAGYGSTDVKTALTQASMRAILASYKFGDTAVRTALRQTHMKAILTKMGYGSTEAKLALRQTDMKALLAYYGYGTAAIRKALTQTNMEATVTSATFSNSAILALKAKVSSVVSTVFGKAEGGVYSGGRWHDIARYASGGLPRGSQLFWARESGPELVGTLGGHTAVMNNDQIVASVAAGVAKAIAGIRFRLEGAFPAITPEMVPAMATGTVIPPGLLRLEEDVGGIRKTVDAILDRLNRMEPSGSAGEISVSARVRERVLFDMTIEQGRLYKTQTGRNPFDI